MSVAGIITHNLLVTNLTQQPQPSYLDNSVVATTNGLPIVAERYTSFCPNGISLERLELTWNVWSIDQMPGTKLSFVQSFIPICLWPFLDLTRTCLFETVPIVWSVSLDRWTRRTHKTVAFENGAVYLLTQKLRNSVLFVLQQKNSIDATSPY